MGKIKIRKMMKDRLHNLYADGYGVSKKEMEKKFGGKSPYIHSAATYETYKKNVDKFCDYCMSIGVKYPEQMTKSIIQSYIDDLKNQGKSAWTIQTYLSGILKCFKYQMNEFDVPKRNRGNIMRSRGIGSSRVGHINYDNYKPLITFEKSFGLRNFKELQQVRKSHLERTADGSLILKNIKGKGGRIRDVKFYGSEDDLKLILAHISLLDDNSLLFPTVPSGLDVHGLRGVYAERVYLAHKRDFIPDNEKYVCRKDKKGKSFDKRALKVVSEALGHSRLDVVVNNYLYRVQ